MTLETNDKAIICFDPVNRPKFRGVNFAVVHHLVNAALASGDRVTIRVPGEFERKAIIVDLLEGPKGYVHCQVHFDDDHPNVTYSFLARDIYTWWKVYLEALEELKVDGTSDIRDMN